MYQFLESIRIEDSIPRNLSWHQKRVDETFKNFFPEQNPFSLAEHISTHKINDSNKLKCRIIYKEQIQKIEFIPYHTKTIKNFKLIEINNFDYSYKFAERSFFTDIQSSFPEADDFIFIRNNLITDSSYANLVFENNTGLYTPQHPLLPGTTRARLLAEGRIKLKDISVDDLKNYHSFYLVNALLDDDFQDRYDLSIIF